MRLCTWAMLGATAVLGGVAGCAADKEVPPPPKSNVIDVTQPADLDAPRALLEQAAGKAGEARKVDAYSSSEGCAEVADFYQGQMKSAHWSAVSLSQTQAPLSPAPAPRTNPAGLPQFTQKWKYMSRVVYVTGAAPKNGAGCVVMTASYGKQPASRSQSR